MKKPGVKLENGFHVGPCKENMGMLWNESWSPRTGGIRNLYLRCLAEAMTRAFKIDSTGRIKELRFGRW